MKPESDSNVSEVNSLPRKAKGPVKLTFSTNEPFSFPSLQSATQDMSSSDGLPPCLPSMPSAAAATPGQPEAEPLGSKSARHDPRTTGRPAPPSISRLHERVDGIVRAGRSSQTTVAALLLEKNTNPFLSPSQAKVARPPPPRWPPTPRPVPSSPAVRPPSTSPRAGQAWASALWGAATPCW